MELSYEQVVSFMRQLDAAEGQDVEILSDNWRLAVTAWPNMDVPDAPVPDAPVQPGMGVPGSSLGVPGSSAAAPVSAPGTRGAVIKSPAVGYFHASGVVPGQHVKADEQVGEITVSGGVMVSVKAAVDGRIVELLPADGDFVEYGEAIAEVEPV